MESIKNVPVSLYKTLSDKLVSIILDSEDRDAVSAEMTKKIIYLWRQDMLASPTGIEALVKAAVQVDSTAVVKVMDDLGLQELTVAVNNL
ncbi:MAG TPA: hypothetical protein VMW03_03195 [Candidatus Krumholzibacteriaceae bacterium]|nr:hypothetical protein [Candidatus Krumholzibacteriaceae bacterium]